MKAGVIENDAGTSRTFPFKKKNVIGLAWRGNLNALGRFSIILVLRYSMAWQNRAEGK